MHSHAIRSGPGYLTLALLLIAPPAAAMDAPTLPAATANAMAQAASPQAIAEYRRRLAEYQEVRGAFEEEAGAYWNAITEKRRGRNAKRREHQPIALDDYVLTQPPVYSGPRGAVNPAPERDPDRLPPEQGVRVYSFETGGTGNYDVQAGIEHGGTRAISTAIGYNQLLTTNSVELIAEQGPEIVAALTAKAAQLSGAPLQTMDYKIAVLRRMVALARSVPD